MIEKRLIFEYKEELNDLYKALPPSEDDDHGVYFRDEFVQLARAFEKSTEVDLEATDYLETLFTQCVTKIAY